MLLNNSGGHFESIRLIFTPFQEFFSIQTFVHRLLPNLLQNGKLWICRRMAPKW